MSKSINKCFRIGTVFLCSIAMVVSVFAAMNIGVSKAGASEKIDYQKLRVTGMFDYKAIDLFGLNIKFHVPAINGKEHTNGIVLQYKLAGSSKWKTATQGGTKVKIKGVGSKTVNDASVSCLTNYSKDFKYTSSDCSVFANDIYPYTFGKSYFRLYQPASDGYAASYSSTISYYNFEDANQTNIGYQFEEPINWLASNNVTTGYDSKHFGPTGNITRIQMVMFLARYAKKFNGEKIPNVKSCGFKDIKQGQEAMNSVCWAKSKGITVGASKFNPTNTVTRVQMALFLYRFAGEPKYSTSHKFSDLKGYTSDYKKAIEWMYQSGVSQGVDAKHKKYNPKGFVQRQQMAKFLYSFYNYQNPKDLFSPLAN
ncbi:MAG: S-layer homology domain-containing protein [Candidatus Ancillula sp.]|nr:S-layer homology domain-containing protein [Candidatus Ancillula sp.]